MAPLPPRDQRHLWLHYQIEGYTKEIVYDFEKRLETIFGRQVNRVHILNFEGLTPDTRQDLAERMRMVYTRENGQEDRGRDGVRCEEMAEDGFRAYWLGCERLVPDKGDLSDYCIEISSGKDFLRGAPSYTYIRDLVRRHAEGRKSGARLSGGHFIRRFTHHFGLVSDDGLRGLSIVAPPELERQQVAAAGALGAAKDAPAVDEGVQADPAPIKAPQQPPPPPPAAESSLADLDVRKEIDEVGEVSIIRSDLYRVTKPSTSPTAFISISACTWHQRLGHLGVIMVRSMWLFKHKFHADGTLSRYKARLVANGSSQQLGVDFDETFSPVVKPATIRTVLSLAVVLRLLTYLYMWMTSFSQLPVHPYFNRLYKKYALQLLECAHMVTCNPSRTPVDTESKLGPKGALVQDPTLYRSLARGASGTLHLGLHLYASSTISLIGYTDADWAGCPSTRMSTSGYYVFLGDNLLSWFAKQQHTLSRSSAKAEYLGVANVVTEIAWLRNLLRELHYPLSTATPIYCVNVSVVYMSVNPVQHQWTKHIETDIHFVRDMVTAGQDDNSEALQPNGRDKLVISKLSLAKASKESHVAMKKAQEEVGFTLFSLTKQAQDVTSRNDSLAIRGKKIMIQGL
ncbi:ribonuclease H-like domain-containing protein, partial [Tanacetum coccineum]